MTRERFDFLFEQFRAGRITAEDWKELRAAIGEQSADPGLQKDLFQLLQQDIVHPEWNKALESSMWQTILQEREQPVGPVPMAVVPMRRRILQYSAIAAAVLLCVAMAWLFIPSSTHSVAVSAGKVDHDIRPGGNKAILTLADGRRIELDSARNGQIAHQGSAAISKDNGMISVSPGPGAGIDAGSALVSTPRGGQYLVVLPDGSKVWLNASSSLKFPTVFTGRERRVVLTGEGYFEIAKNASIPFHVSVNDMDIRVLGTSFDAMAYSDEATINTTLLQGSVEVSQGNLVRRLSPGQQSMLNSAGHQISVGQADLQKTIAWKNGLFEFDHTDLQAIMRQLTRWYDIEVIYKIRPENTPLGGSISKNLNLMEVLELLEANGINHFKIEGRKVYVLQ